MDAARQRTRLRGEVISQLRQVGDRHPCISQVWLYDARGSELFDEITELEEYYLTRAETKILEKDAGSIAASGGCTKGKSHHRVIELGAGSGTKTQILLRAFAELCKTTYTPIDVSEEAMDGCVALCESIPNVSVEPVVGTFDAVLKATVAKPQSDSDASSTVMFLGSSVGNYDDDEIIDLFNTIKRSLGPRDRFIIGFDGAHSDRKSSKVIHEAYNDAKGVTAEFTLNALLHLNAATGSNFNISNFAHQAVYSKEKQSIITHIVCKEAQTVSWREDGKEIDSIAFVAGEEIFIEQSRKFHPSDMKRLAHQSGMTVTKMWEAETYGYYIAEMVA